MKAGKRRLLYFIGGFFAVMLVIVLALPLWMPWLLGVLAPRYGVTYQTYHRKGASRFVLDSVGYTNGSVIFSARRVELALPTVWTWRVVRSDASATFVEIEDWQLRVVSTNRTTADAPSKSTRDIVTDIASIMRRLERWVPEASLTNGIAIVANERLAVPVLHWKKGDLSVAVASSRLPAPIALQVGAPVGNALAATATYEPLQLFADVRLNTSSNRLSGNATVDVLTNRLTVTATFDRNSTVPEVLLVDSPSFRVAGSQLKLNDYTDVGGKLAFAWFTNAFSASVDVSGTAKPGSALPPINLTLRADGDLRQIAIRQFAANIPGAVVTLSQPIVLPMGRTSAPVMLKLVGDLSKQPWLAVTGTLDSELLLTASTNLFPRVAFKANAENVRLPQLPNAAARMEGNLEWPILRLDSARISITNAGEARVSGTTDFARQQVSQAEVAYEGANPLQITNWQVRGIALNARFAGPFKELVHTGEVTFRGLKARGLAPLDIQTQFTGRGRSLTATGTVLRGSSLVDFSAAADLGSAINRLTISGMQLQRSNAPLMKLEKPFSVSYAASSNRWSTVVSPMSFAGPAGSFSLAADVNWPLNGTLKGSLEGVGFQNFADFLPEQVLPLRVERLSFDGNWSNGPVSFVVAGATTYAEASGFTGRGTIVGGESGLTVSNVTVVSESAPVVVANGFLPLRINPARTNWIDWSADAALKFEAQSRPDQPFWENFARLTGVQVAGPNLLASIGGSWHSPTGSLHATATSIRGRGTNLPPAEHLRLNAQFRDGKLLVDPLTFEIQKQPLTLTGEFPVDAEFYRALSERRLPDWRRAQAHLAIRRAPVAAFTRYFPRIIEPLGNFEADLDLRENGRVFGQLTLEGLTTRPLGRLGAIRDITGSIRVEQSSLLLDQLHGTIGGEPLRVFGSADLPSSAGALEKVPPFQFRLEGTNIPLAREPQAIIRSDLAISFLHTNDAQPLISGTIRLRDSIYTSDLTSLLPGNVSKPAQRPPYFSIEAEPIANWRLDCRVKGDQFLKMRTPFFRGAVSADFKLEGSLREPLASGEATVANGHIEFPFGTLDVKSGIVSLTAANPYQPQLFVMARARRLGFDITLQVTGSADKPIIQFSSVPSLSSDQILLLLTAGEVPREDFTLTPQQKAQRFAVFFGQRFLTKLGIGGDSERLSIRSGEDVSQSGRQTYDVELKLDENWSLVGQYDRFNQFNLSVKRRVYSR